MSASIAIVLTALGLAQPVDLDTRIREAESITQGGQLTLALERYERILVDLPTDSPRRGEVLIAMAMLENRQGRYEASRGYATKAVELYGGLGNRAREADALNVVGLSYLYAGDYRAAMDWLKRAAALSDAAGDAAGHAEHLSNLGNVYFFLGRYDEAASAYTAGTALVQRHLGEAWASRRLRILRLNDAALKQRLGQYQEALAVYRLEDDNGALRPDERAQGLVNQGALYRRLGDPVKAMDAYREAEALFLTAKHVDGELGAIINRGIVLALDLGEMPHARATFSEALTRAIQADSRREAVQARLYRAEAALREGDLVSAATDFEDSHAAATDLKTPEESWKALYGLGRVARRRGRPADAVKLLERAVSVIEGLREELRIPNVRADFFQEKREVYDALIEAQLESSSPAQIFGLMERSRARAWRDRLGLSSQVALAHVQGALADDTVMLAYWHSSAGAAVVRVTRDGATLTRVTVSDALLRSLVLALSDPHAEWRALADEVGSALVPQGAVGPAIKRVIVIPDGPLAGIPLETLTVDGAPLVTRAAVSYLPTAALILRAKPAEATGVQVPWRTTLAAFGDPRYGPGGQDDGDAPPPLPHSAREIAAIAAELGGRHRLYLGPEFHKSRLTDRATEPAPIIHLATHAIVHQAIERSRILFSSTSGDGPPESLFLREVYDLDLGDVELAVLSACDTERGPLLSGEGRQTFSRGLLAAGAHSTLTTLWEVPDDTPVGLMSVFYHRLQQGDGRDEALRQGKLALLHSGDVRAHPHYWAPYVLTGDAGAIAFPPRWRQTAALALVVLAGLAFIALVRPQRHS